MDSRSFENHVGATLRRGTFLEDAAELDVNEFPNGSATGDNKQWLWNELSYQYYHQIKFS